MSECRQSCDGNAAIGNIIVGDSQGTDAVYTIWGAVRWDV